MTARAYATAAGTLLCLLGAAGFVANPGFGTGEAIPPGGIGPIDLNGWQSGLYLVAGLAGLALAVPVPRLYCLGAAVAWSVLAVFGFFGAHGGESIPSMGDRLLATTSTNVITLGLASLAWLALLARTRRDESESASRRSRRYEDRRSATESTTPDIGETDRASSIGRPRTSSAPRGGRTPIN